jgi:hypothetical protein
LVGGPDILYGWSSCLLLGSGSGTGSNGKRVPVSRNHQMWISDVFKKGARNFTILSLLYKISLPEMNKL